MKNKNKILLIILGVFLLITLIGGTYALYRFVLFKDLNVNTITKGLDYYINYEKGTNVFKGDLIPSPSYNGGLSTTVSFWKKDNTYDIYGHIYLDINSISTELAENDALKYTVVDSDNYVIATGSFYQSTTSSSILALGDISLKTEEEVYTIYIWYDERFWIGNEYLTALDIDVRCDATMKPLNNAVSYITNIYNNSAKSTVSNNNVTYNYAASVNMMYDNKGNFRYYGASPNNYVWLGETYTNDYTIEGITSTNEIEPNDKIIPSGSKRLYRIISVADGKLKLITEDSVGTSPWDTSVSSVNSGFGINAWPQADLMKVLNPDYNNNSDNDINGNLVVSNNSLFWNKTKGTCFSGKGSETANCDFSETGFSTDAKSKIVPAIWRLGTIESEAITEYPAQIFEEERANSMARKSNWEGKVGLMYPSDYGFAVDFTKCQNKTLDYYNTEECKNNNWLLYSILGEWTITSRSSSDENNYVYYIKNDGTLASNYAASASQTIRPVIYLNSNLAITSGDGSKNNPFVLE